MYHYLIYRSEEDNQKLARRLEMAREEFETQVRNDVNICTVCIYFNLHVHKHLHACLHYKIMVSFTFSQ